MDLPLNPVRYSTFDVRRKTSDAKPFGVVEFIGPSIGNERGRLLEPSNVERRTSNIERRANNSSAFIRQGGFTVLELFVATTLLVVISGMLFAVFNQASNAWLSGSATMDRQSSARLALEMMNRELASAYVSPNAGANTSIKFFGSSNAVYFVATLPPSAGTSNGFGEFAYKSISSSGGLTNLYRFFTQDVTLIRNDLSLFTNNFTVAAYPNPDAIAENVLSMSLIYDDTNGTQFTAWDSTSSSSPTQLNQLPSIVEVTLTLMDSRHAQHMPPLGSAAYNYYTNNYSRTYNTIIRLQNAPAP